MPTLQASKSHQGTSPGQRGGASRPALLVPEEVGVRRRSERRSGRWSRQYWLRENSALRGVRGCHLPVASAVRVGVVSHGSDLVAHASGVGRCGSPWSCALCTAVVREKRAGFIDQGVAEALARGWVVLFVTETLPHSHQDPLSRTFDLLRDGHRRTRSGRAWQSLAEAHGYVGTIRAWEVTHGRRHGWHPHGHELLIFRGAGDDIEEVVAEHYRRTYGAFIEAKTGRPLHQVHGVDVRRVTSAGDLAEYLVKVDGGWGAGLEIARADLKRSNGGRSAWQVLDGAFRGSASDAALWAEYEEATSGRRAISWSVGLHEVLGVIEDATLTDEQAAASEGEGEEVWSLEVPADTWVQLLRARSVAEFLEECEHEAARALGREPPPPADARSAASAGAVP